MKNKKVEKLQEEIIKLKCLNEQLESEISKKERFIEDNYPTINDFQVRDGWHGGGMATYRVTIDVFAEDLHKLVRFFTHKSLRGKKWSIIKSQIKEQIRNEIESENK